MEGDGKIRIMLKTKLFGFCSGVIFSLKKNILNARRDSNDQSTCNLILINFTLFERHSKINFTTAP